MLAYSVLCQYTAQVCNFSCKKIQYLILVDSKVAIGRGGFLHLYLSL